MRSQTPFFGGKPLFSSQWNTFAGKINRNFEFKFDLKGNVEAILALTGTSDRVSFKVAQHPALHTGQTASLVDEQGQVVGYLGKLHPLVQQKLDLEGAIYVFELLLTPLLTAKLPKFKEIIAEQLSEFKTFYLHPK